MKTAWTLTLFSLMTALTVEGGRININHTHTTATGPGIDGPGILGGGTWNRINIAQKNGPNALLKSNGAASSVTHSETSSALSAPFLNGNPVQSESWGPSVAVTIAGLLPNQVYKVAIYTDRGGNPVEPPYTFIVNGVSKTSTNPGVAVTALPGTENIDYLIFVVNATAAGVITIGGGNPIAGIQIEGLLDNSEKGPQMDCRIKKTGAGSGGKGNGLYSVNTNRAQSLTQKTIGRRAKRYYVNIENDGNEIDNCYAMAFLNGRKATIRVIHRGGGGNVTAAALQRNYRYDLCKNETARFKVVVKPSSRQRATIRVQLCGSPSTLTRNRQDCSTCVLKVLN